jgi:glycosyltransferase involved in cell wall biosynthesis
VRIAQVAPLHESVPPRYYGGTERVVAYLTEELVRQGHEVTLFASGDSTTSARLVSACPESLRWSPSCADPLAHHILLLELVAREANTFDIIHYHIDYLHFPLSRRQAACHLTTLHGRLDLPELLPLYREFAEMPLVAVSTAHRVPLPWANWQGTVHHGLPVDLYPFHERRGDYLAFLGRISPEKRVDRAIAIAQQMGLPIKIGAKVDKVDREYFKEAIKPLFALPGVEYLGEISEVDKGDFLGQAYALVFPIDWDEPFGLVMIEAMACGTPVVGFRGGSVPEVLDEGVTGFCVDSVSEAVRALEALERVDRRQVRATFERRFTAARMAREYVAIYQRLHDRVQGYVPSEKPRLTA